MRRIAPLAAALLLLAAAPAAAWVETAAHDVPDGRPATCLREAGPGRLTLSGALTTTATTLDLLAADARSLTLGAPPTTLGRLSFCPVVATAAGVPPLLAGFALVTRGDGRRDAVLRVADAGTRPLTIRPRRSWKLRRVAAAIAPGGAAVVVWTEERPGRAGPPVRVLAIVRRSAQAPFGRPVVLERAADGERTPVAGIDAAGRATVAWSAATYSPNNVSTLLRAASSDAAGGFASAQTVARLWGGHFALAVAPSGRTLIAADARGALAAYERLPGQARLARIPLPARGGSEEVAVALNADGGSAIAYRSDERAVAVLLRPPGGSFGSEIAVVPRKPDEGGDLGTETFTVITPDLDRLQPPLDDDGGDLRAALSADGQVALSWIDETDQTDGDEAPSAHVAHGTLSGGVETPQRLGSPCRSAAAIAPFPFADGTLGVAWSDDAQARTAEGGTWGRGRGRVHLALDAPPAGFSEPPAAPAPGVSAELAGPARLHTGEPLRVRVRCEQACDVRASAKSHSVSRKPRLRNVISRSDDERSAGSTTLPAGGSAVLRLYTPSGYNVGVAAGRPVRAPIVVSACTPGGPFAERVEVAPPGVAPRRPIPFVRDLTAVQRGDTVRVTWRTTVPARHARFHVYAVTAGDPPLVTRAGRGRTHFAVTVRDAADARAVWVYLDTPERVVGPSANVRVS